MIEKLKQIGQQLPDTILDLILLMLITPRKFIKEIDQITIDNLHYYLQIYNVTEITVLSVLLYAFLHQSEFIVQNGLTMEDTKILALSAIPLTIWPLIQIMVTSLNKDIGEVYSVKPKGVNGVNLTEEKVE